MNKNEYRIGDRLYVSYSYHNSKDVAEYCRKGVTNSCTQRVLTEIKTS